ncbi:hypothetical protein SRHO_G00054110 [Serrasalmus rhombeus]
MMHHCSITSEIKNKTLNFNQATVNGPVKDDGLVWAGRGAEAIALEKRPPKGVRFSHLCSKQHASYSSCRPGASSPL